MKIILILGMPGTGKSSILNTMLQYFPNTATAFSVRKYADYIIGKDSASNLADMILEERKDKGILTGNVINQLVESFITSNKGLYKWLFLENYPLSQKQFTFFKQLTELNNFCVQAIYLYGPYNVLEKRIQTRIICPRCDKKSLIEPSFSEEYKICPNCGSQLEQRVTYADDTFDRILSYEHKLKVVTSNIENMMSYDTSKYTIAELCSMIIKHLEMK